MDQCATFDAFMKHVLNLRKKRLDIVMSGNIGDLTKTCIDHFCEPLSGYICKLCNENRRFFSQEYLQIMCGSYPGTYTFVKEENLQVNLKSSKHEIQIFLYLLNILKNDILATSVYSWICRTTGYQISQEWISSHDFADSQKYSDLIRHLDHPSAITDTRTPLKPSTIYAYLASFVETLNDERFNWVPMTYESFRFTPDMRRYTGTSKTVNGNYVVDSRISIYYKSNQSTSFKVNTSQGEKIFTPDLPNERMLASFKSPSFSLVDDTNNMTWSILNADDLYRNILLGKIDWGMSRDIVGVLVLISFMTETPFGITMFSEPTLTSFLSTLVLASDQPKFYEIMRSLMSRNDTLPVNIKVIMKSMTNLVFYRGFYDKIITLLNHVYPK